ncbi:hypothetical protein GCM10009530_16160 [Microbispora corallina]|uniref:MarR family transcriptional regulator n=1 Tax=Microbispora corallina TaxID=83302 RepID=A0ABQ4FXN0_9ACTN|nr:hypothetical protein [Microbispora corallina]GIH39575.1 hypothetical protein Mco01_25750 [Microbispora corallina]
MRDDGAGPAEGRAEESLGDAQEMSSRELTVYEAVATLNVDERPATVSEIAGMTELPEDDVRRALGGLADGGRLVRDGEAYKLGAHDWGLDY